ncbi:thioesterase family protein [Jeotgalibacillus marinus]|uniref:Thioesterase n=1 Tax=Jeotgalibacillus marinus TaxID=86667 RepID=A0ABV3Q3M0_9BACL
MKPGLKIGYEEKLVITVSSDMFARFDNSVVHPLYSTVSLVYHMEWVSRNIIHPYLEEDEEGMGVEVEVKHISAANEGSMVEFHAKVTTYTEKAVITSIEVYSSEKLVATGTVKQAILPKKIIEKMY